MTAKMLQLVNSAFFGFARNVSSPIEAVQLLGIGRIRALALSILIFSAFESRKITAFTIESAWKHSVETALGAQQIARMETEDETFLEQSFSAGLLHDLGKLILADNLPEPYEQAIRKSAAEETRLVQEEKLAFGATHAELGAYLLEMWGLPVPLVEAVAWHHTPEEAQSLGFCPLTVVHVANALRPSGNGLRSSAAISTDYLQAVGKTDRLAAWRAALKV
jgi:HD-like signal output (HDOD) protein